MQAAVCGHYFLEKGLSEFDGESIRPWFGQPSDRGRLIELGTVAASTSRLALA